jgi:hypothetical protein
MTFTREEWLRMIESSAGLVVYWLAQKEDENMLKKCPEGVCHALTSSWIESKTSLVGNTKKFSRDFHNDLKGSIKIPENYIAAQLRYNDKISLAKITTDTLKKTAMASDADLNDTINNARKRTATFQQFEAARDKAAKDRKTLLNYAKVAQGGPRCLVHKSFPSGSSISEVFEFLEKKKYLDADPEDDDREKEYRKALGTVPRIYCALSMIDGLGGGSSLGHIIGISIGAFCEIFDANVALAYFTEWERLSTFFVIRVFPNVYEEQFNVFNLYFYAAVWDEEEDEVEEKGTQDKTPEERKQIINSVPSKKSQCVIM